MKHILVFGSLRKNSKRGYNFNRFGSEKYIKDVQLDGYEMFDLGPFPAICPGNGKIKTELHSVSDEAFQNILGMEIGAGYKELKVKVGKISASIFVMDKERLQKLPRVESGDWN